MTAGPAGAANLQRPDLADGGGDAQRFERQPHLAGPALLTACGRALPLRRRGRAAAEGIPVGVPGLAHNAVLAPGATGAEAKVQVAVALVARVHEHLDAVVVPHVRVFARRRGRQLVHVRLVAAEADGQGVTIENDLHAGLHGGQFAAPTQHHETADFRGGLPRLVVQFAVNDRRVAGARGLQVRALGNQDEGGIIEPDRALPVDDQRELHRFDIFAGCNDLRDFHPAIGLLSRADRLGEVRELVLAELVHGDVVRGLAVDPHGHAVYRLRLRRDGFLAQAHPVGVV